MDLVNDTTEVQVARGAAWLDRRYPDWWKSIDLAVLDLSRCDVCVLGQVYHGHISQEERDQLLAQVLEKSYASPLLLDYGFNVLSRWHELTWFGAAKLGFAVESCLCMETCPSECAGFHGYTELVDEWTRVVIQRRLDQHRDVLVSANLDS